MILKRIGLLTMALLFTSIFLAGCALFALDVAANNNLVVARIAKPNGGEITISRLQLSDAFNSWGSQFITQGMSPEQAVNTTLDALIDREILVYLSMQDQFFGAHGDGFKTAQASGDWSAMIEQALTPQEREEALRLTFSEFERQVRTINTRIRNGHNLQDAPELAPEPEGQPVFSPYVHYVNVIGTGPTASRRFELNISRFGTPERQETPPTIAEFLARVFAPRNNTSIEVSIANETREQLIRDLRNRETGLRFENNEWQDVATREINNILMEQRRQVLTQRFQDTFSQGIMSAGREAFELFANRFESEQALIDWQNMIHGHWAPVEGNPDETEWVQGASQAYVNDLVSRARWEYMRNVRMAIDAWNKGDSTESSIREQLIAQGGLANLRWAPSHIMNDYFTVSHILIGFSEEDQARANDLQRQFDRQEISEDFLLDQLALMRRDLKVRARDEFGREHGDPMTPTQILQEVQDAVLRGPTREEGFRDMIDRFNSDHGMQNATFEYVLGRDIRPLDQHGRPIPDGSPSGDPTSGMVRSFTDAARLLHNGEVDWSGHSGRGAMTGLVPSQFGYHIIMFTRNVGDFIFHTALNSGINPETTLAQQYHNFLFARQTSYGNQTFFDTIVQSLTRHEFREAEAAVRIAHLQNLGEGGVTRYPGRFRNLWN